ncbi:MAG: hypothetical protein ACREI9_15360, partial [Nitrospiraceae bacterium]
MAFIDIPGWPINYPPLLGDGSNAGIGTTVTLNAATEKCAFVFPAPKDGTINRGAFRFGTIIQNPINGLTVSLQDLDA